MNEDEKRYFEQFSGERRICEYCGKELAIGEKHTALVSSHDKDGVWLGYCLDIDWSVPHRLPTIYSEKPFDTP